MRKIFVKPSNLNGSIQHYFHFMFGYLIPFLDNVSENDGNTYVFKDCGPCMNKLLFSIPGYKVEIGSQWNEEISFAGYDDPQFPGMDMRSSELKLERVFSIVALRDSRILVVDRATPDPFYEKSDIPESGTSRRSVPNMGHIFSRISAPKQFVHLEGLGLSEQFALFRSSQFFVMQHGAAMCNLIMAPNNSCLVEIRGEEDIDYYERLISFKRIRRIVVEQEQRHAPVGSEVVLESMRKLMSSSLKIL